MMATPFFCAICAADIAGEPRQAPLGRDRAMVNICERCDQEMAEERSGPQRSYEPSGGFLKDAELTRALRQKMGDEAYEKQIARDIDVGHIPTSLLASHLQKTKKRRAKRKMKRR